MVRAFRPARTHRRRQLTGSIIARADRGLVDVDLGGGLVKQRIARPGQGRSSGYRVILAHKAKSRSIFLIGFAKNEKENVSADEFAILRQLAQNWLTADTAMIRDEAGTGNLQEIDHDEETEQSIRSNS